VGTTTASARRFRKQSLASTQTTPWAGFHPPRPVASGRAFPRGIVGRQRQRPVPNILDREAKIRPRQRAMKLSKRLVKSRRLYLLFAAPRCSWAGANLTATVIQSNPCQCRAQSKETSRAPELGSGCLTVHTHPILWQDQDRLKKKTMLIMIVESQRNAWARIESMGPEHRGAYSGLDRPKCLRCEPSPAQPAHELPVIRGDSRETNGPASSIRTKMTLIQRVFRNAIATMHRETLCLDLVRCRRVFSD
jgi:hypothetical protein